MRKNVKIITFVIYNSNKLEEMEQKEEERLMINQRLNAFRVLVYHAFLWLESGNETCFCTIFTYSVHLQTVNSSFPLFRFKNTWLMNLTNCFRWFPRTQTCTHGVTSAWRNLSRSTIQHQKFQNAASKIRSVSRTLRVQGNVIFLFSLH